MLAEEGAFESAKEQKRLLKNEMSLIDKEVKRDQEALSQFRFEDN